MVRLGFRAALLQHERMNQLSTPTPEGSEGAAQDEAAATEDETRAFLLERSLREAAPVPKMFVQNPDKSLPVRRAPLSVFVQNGDLRGLKAFLFLHAIISSGDGDNGWSSTLPLSVWARVFDTTKTAEARSASTAATKILTRLVERRLIKRDRVGRSRKVTVTLLRPDGSGAPYTRPSVGNNDLYFNLSNAYWTDGWNHKLDLPATAMLLVALHERAGFQLVTERVPDWYGWSADTAERGLGTLANLGLIHVSKQYKKAPLSPTGLTLVNTYTLMGPFSQARTKDNPATNAVATQSSSANDGSGPSMAAVTSSNEAKEKSVKRRAKKAGTSSRAGNGRTER